MIILKLILCVIILIVIPELLGLFFTKFMTEKYNIFLSIVVGYVGEFALFEFIYLPMYFLKLSFKTVCYTWSALVLVLTMLIIIFSFKLFKDIFYRTKKYIKEMPKILTIIFLLLISVQVYFPVRYMQIIDPDDAFYLSTVNTTIETNSLFKYNAYDGEEYKKSPIRYTLSGLVIYFATLSYLIKLHPAIFTHTVWPAIIIILENIIYFEIAKKLFNKNKEKTAIFMIFLVTLHIWGYISIFINYAFFAYRSWQGKSLIGNFVIPMIWLCFLYCRDERSKIINWILLFLVMISACFVTEIGVFLAPLTLGILSLFQLIESKKIIDFCKYMICCLPELIIGVLYVIGV